MNIVSLKIKNFLSLVDVEIKPGKVTQIVGDNGQGKTSILKALDFAVQGSNDPSLVRLGEDSAEVLVELSDATLIRRRLNSQGRQSVEVTREGMKATSPQALLGALFDQSSFNPLELLDPKKRAEAIMKSIDLKLDESALAAALEVEAKDLPPLDFSQHGLKVLEQCYRYFYGRRAEANKDAAEKKKRWETYAKDFKAVERPKMDRKEIEVRRESCLVTIAQMEAQIARVEKAAEESRKADARLARYLEEQQKITSELRASEEALASLESETQRKIDQIIREAEEQKSKLERQISAEKGRLEFSKKFVEEAKVGRYKELEGDGQFRQDKYDAERELEQLKTAEKEIEAYEATEKNFEMIDQMRKEFETSDAFAGALDARVTALAGRVKKDLMASAEMPIKGLEYVDGQFLVDGVAVDNLSTAAAMRLAVAVARKLSKKAKVICIDGAESLDSKTWTAFKNEIKDDGFTYFVTKVGTAHEDSDGSIVPMQEGQVVQ